MNFGKPKTHDLIHDIGAMRKSALLLKGKGKSYDVLLIALLKTDYFNVEDTPWPEMEYLKSATGLTYDKVRKELAKIYEDLKLGYLNGITFKMQKVEYMFFIRAYGKYLNVQFEDILQIPRVGETVNIPFFESYVGSYFHVERVEHHFSDTTHEITFWLTPGSYNVFEAFKKDKDYSEGRISFKEYHDMK